MDENAESYLERRNLLLKEVPADVIRKAWFTLAHLLLDPGARVADMGCEDGAMTYAMAAMAPKIKFTGLDKSKRQINRAKEKYQLHNLTYQVGDVASAVFEEDSLDAVINSYILHAVYSGSRYNERLVGDTLRNQFRMLKKGGVMFIRDFARPPPGEFVLLEMPDKPSTGTELSKLSDADLLIWYSEHARPRHDAGTGGFFLEEMPARFPGTRLFRLPYKWAYEFIMRKDDRDHWETELPIEYTFFTTREFRRELGSLGARVQYSAPYWDEDIIDKRFEGHFTLYRDDGTPLGPPPTCFIAVAYKLGERRSLHIEERRSTTAEAGSLTITAMQDQHTGKLVDVVTRNMELFEILPYRVDEEERLKIYLHDGATRSIANAMPRNGENLEEKRWSGHMVEPISIDGQAISEIGALDAKNSARFARSYLGLTPQDGAALTHGPDYYPAPDYIDERIHTCYLAVKPPAGAITPRLLLGADTRYQAKGEIREMDAQQILDAITVGMIPNARLELQILSLFEHLKLKAENWVMKNAALHASEAHKKKSLRTILDSLGMEKGRFKNIKGTVGDLRPIHSIFVEEGQARGTVTGLASQEVDFVIFDEKTTNTAVVLPLMKGLKNDVHAGFFVEHLPVPQRYEGTSLTVSAPSFNLPRDIKNLKQAKKYLADKFGVLPEMVIKLGEAYFSHIGVTPQKIYPFAVTVPPSWPGDPKMQFLPFYQLKFLRKSLGWDNKSGKPAIRDTNLLVTIARSYKYLHDELRLDAALQAKAIIKQRFESAKPEWSLPLSYHRAPILPPPRADAPPEPKAAAPKDKPALVPAPDTAPKGAPDMVEDFERELEEFVEALENEKENKPRPGRW